MIQLINDMPIITEATICDQQIILHEAINTSSKQYASWIRCYRGTGLFSYVDFQAAITNLGFHYKRIEVSEPSEKTQDARITGSVCRSLSLYTCINRECQVVP